MDKKEEQIKDENTEVKNVRELYEFSNMYILDGVGCKCLNGEYIQPVTSTHIKNTYYKGEKILTELDCLVGENENILDFGQCKLDGKCCLTDIKQIRWENVRDDIKIENARPLLGDSFFYCPKHREVKITFSNSGQEDDIGIGEGKKSTAEKVGDYLCKSVKTVVLGDFASDKDITLLGVGIQVALGFTGLDFVMDIRDTIACWRKGDWLGVGLSVIGLCPVVGAVFGAVKSVIKKEKTIAKATLNLGEKAVDKVKKLHPNEIGKDLKKVGKNIYKIGKYSVELSRNKALRDRAIKTLKDISEVVIVSFKEPIETTKCVVRSIFGFEGCFSEDTYVKVKTGYKKIKDIDVGEKIYSYNEITKEIELQRVINLKKAKVKTGKIEIKLQNGTIIDTTENHPFMTDSGIWKVAGELTTKDMLINQEFTFFKIESLTRKGEDKEELYYDIELENTHSYFVSKDDILVHNVECLTAQINKALERGNLSETAILETPYYKDVEKIVQESGNAEKEYKAFDDMIKNDSNLEKYFDKENGAYLEKINGYDVEKINGKVEGRYDKPKYYIETKFSKYNNNDRCLILLDEDKKILNYHFYDDKVKKVRSFSKVHMQIENKNFEIFAPLYRKKDIAFMMDLCTFKPRTTEIDIKKSLEYIYGKELKLYDVIEKYFTNGDLTVEYLRKELKIPKNIRKMLRKKVIKVKRITKDGKTIEKIVSFDKKKFKKMFVLHHDIRTNKILVLKRMEHDKKFGNYLAHNGINSLGEYGRNISDLKFKKGYKIMRDYDIVEEKTLTYTREKRRYIWRIK